MKILILAPQWLFLLVGFNCSASSLSTWNGGSGDWNTAGNWSPTGVPGSSTDVRIYSGTAQITSGTALSSTAELSSTGAVTVSGTGTLWTNSSYLYVGLNGNGTLDIQNGGVVSTGSGYIGSGYIGRGTGSTGLVTVSGTGSQWTNSTPLYVGFSGNGTLNIQNGGVVSSTYCFIGNDAGSTSLVTVSGAGSQWTNSAYLFVGYFGSGTLTVAAGGKVSTGAGFGTPLAISNSATGTLNLNGTSGSRGVLETAYLNEGIGTGGGHVNFDGGILRATADSADFLQNFETGDVQILSGGAFFDTNGHNVTVSTALQGAGGLNKQGTGTLTLSGASTYTGATTVEAGTLSVTGSLTSDVTIQNGGTLAGTGSVQAVTVQSGGTLSPGIGPGGMGTLNTGGETWAGGGTYAWDVNAKPADGTAGVNWDFINMSGGLNISATSGDRFIIDINGTLSGVVPFSLLDWTLLSASSGFGGTFAADKFTFDTTDFSSDIGGTFSLLMQGNNLVLEFASIPEPDRMLLLAAGSATLLLRRRRRGAC